MQQFEIESGPKGTHVDASKPYSNALKKKYPWSPDPKWSDLPDRELYSNRPDLQVIDNSICTSKYTLLSFIPKNLVEQFSKPANVYFLLICVLQTYKPISLSNGFPILLLPLAFIISLSMLKDLIEDLKRKRSDNEENSKTVHVFRDKRFVEAEWRSLRIGEIIKVSQDQLFPADVLIMKSSDSKGKLYIETKNLDGETNLKQKVVPRGLLDIFESEKDFAGNQFKFRYEKPNPYLYTFNGYAEYSSTKTPCDNSNFVLRGSNLRNTQYAIGLVAYTGHHTKIMLNSTSAKPKRSKLEKRMGQQVVAIFIMQMLLCIFSAGYYVGASDTSLLSYLAPTINNPEQQQSGFTTFLEKIGNWLLIFTNFVPISLLVTLEMVKFIQGMIISSDSTMYAKKIQMNATVQSSNLNEELGQIQYVFSDKTGTLTCNEMEFKKLSLEGIPFGNDTSADVSKLKPVSNVDFKDKKFIEVLHNPEHELHEKVKHYLFVLALCHTIITEKQGDQIIYDASSPDEFALVNFAKFLGVEFMGTDENNTMTVRYNGQEFKYKLLNVLEFTSARKRMSVIIQDSEGKIMLMCKGADSIIAKRMDDAKSEIMRMTEKNLEHFACDGLRTLLIAEKQIEPAEYEKWSERFKEAQTSLDNKEAKIDALQEEIEAGLLLVGATAIEDKLQDEVGVTIEHLKKAGVKVWVLTGDKMETAINIGYSCSLLSNAYIQFILDESTPEKISEKIVTFLQDIQVHKKNDPKTRFALIISGDALIHAIKEPISKEVLKVAHVCEAVLCCRVSPKQKSEVVTLVRRETRGRTTLAIGDGANDVNMIVAAHIGIGIRGVEGQQAARSSDYAIGEFKFLKNLLFVHGRECYRRNTHLVLFNFFKNLVCVLPQFFYGFYNFFSGTSLYDSVLYQFFNIFFVSVPIVIYATLDKQHSANILLDTPKLFEPGMKDMLFNTLSFWRWVADAVFQSAVICFFSYFAFSVAPIEMDGTTPGFWLSGIHIFTMVVIICNLKVLLIASNFSILLLIMTFGSIIFYLAFFGMESLFPRLDIYGMFSEMLSNGTIWMCTFIILVLTTGIDMAMHRYAAIEQHAQDQGAIDERPSKLSIVTMVRALKGFLNKTKNYTGYAFSQEEKIKDSEIKYLNS